MPFFKSKLYAPYDKNGKTNFPIRNKSGVYLIYKKQTLSAGNKLKLVYVGFSTKDLYKTMYRHFQNWDGYILPDQTRVIYKNTKNIKIRVCYTNTAQQANQLETALILKYKPKDNPRKYEKYAADKNEIKILDQFESLESKPIIVNKQYNEEDPF